MIEKDLRTCDDDKKIDRLKAICGRIKIITFNYDVSLEMYLLQRLKKNFPKNSNLLPMAFGVIADEMITHVYGRVASHEEILEDDMDMLNRDNFFDKVKLSGEQFNPDYYVASLGGLMKERKNSFDEFWWRGGLEKGYTEVLGAFLSAILVATLSIKGDLINTIDVIGHERKAAKEKINNLRSQEWDLFYILGYGFDETNNDEILHLKDLKWKGGCFVTNYAVDKTNINQRLERLILDELLSRTQDSEGVEIKSFKIPLISHKTVSEALKTDFSLLEKPKAPIKIKTSLTPYLELKK